MIENNMNIRVARIKDLEMMVEIYNQAISAGEKTADITPFTAAERINWFEEHTPEKYPILVAVKNNSIVGYLTISAYRPGRMALSKTAEVSCYIHFKHHCQGIASRLLRHAVRLSPSLQVKNLLAIVIDTNQASIRFLEKHGFERWGHLPGVGEFHGNEVGHLYYGLRIRGDDDGSRS